jgi:hypothetical protein
MPKNDLFERALSKSAGTSSKGPAAPDLPELPAFDANGAPAKAEVPGVASEHDRGSTPLLRTITVILAYGFLSGGAVATWYYWPRFTDLRFHGGAVAVILGAAFLLYSLIVQFAVWHVSVTPKGLTWTDRQGEHHCAWDDITGVWRTETYMGNQHGERFTRLWVESTGNRPLVVGQTLSDYDRLVETIQSISTACLLPKKRAELAQGEAPFGPVTLRRNAIRMGKKEVAWQNLDHWCLSNGHGVFFKNDSRHIHDTGMIFRLDQVPNYLVLFQLIEELAKPAVPAEVSDRIMLARG